MNCHDNCNWIIVIFCKSMWYFVEGLSGAVWSPSCRIRTNHRGPAVWSRMISCLWTSPLVSKQMYQPSFFLSRSGFLSRYTVNQFFYSHGRKFCEFHENPIIANISLWELDIVYRPILMRNAQSQTLLAVNQFITEKSKNKVAANKSCFTVVDFYVRRVIYTASKTFVYVLQRYIF
jgi:hypothetical protein